MSLNFIKVPIEYPLYALFFRNWALTILPSELKFAKKFIFFLL